MARPGWKLLTQAALQSKALPVLNDFSKISKDPSKPNLLFLHGTFSNALSAYKELATARGSNGQTLLDSVADIYQDRIFAFDHFTVSKQPRENAQDLLDALPPGEHVFDVVTHSRGGLVLRHLVELKGDFGPAASKVKIRRVALVASPNEGTPLATPARFDLFITWISNVLDIFPDNPGHREVRNLPGDLQERRFQDGGDEPPSGGGVRRSLLGNGNQESDRRGWRGCGALPPPFPRLWCRRGEVKRNSLGCVPHHQDMQFVSSRFDLNDEVSRRLLPSPFGNSDGSRRHFAGVDDIHVTGVLKLPKKRVFRRCGRRYIAPLSPSACWDRRGFRQFPAWTI